MQLRAKSLLRLTGSKRARIAAFALVFGPLAWLGVDVGASAFSQNYRIGLDIQKVSCVPYRVFLISKKPFKEKIERGDLVVFHTDLEVFKKQFPGEDDIAKFVAGVPGDRVVVEDDRFYINGVYWDRLWLLDFLKAKNGQFDRSFTVEEGHYLLAATSPGSYDGRYWGTVSSDQITAYAIPLF